MFWPHTVRITRASGAPGVQDAETGVWTPGGDPVVLYDGQGDMQHRIRTIRRSPENDRAVQSDADVFLKDESNLWNVPEGAIIEITDGESVNLQGVVVSMDKLSGVLFVGQLIPKGDESEISVAISGGAVRVSGAGTVNNPDTVARRLASGIIRVPTIVSGEGVVLDPLGSDPNLVAWFTADDTFDALANGADITTPWADRSPSGFSLGQVNNGGATRPKIRRNVVNGRSAVELAGGGHYAFGGLISATLRATSCVVFIVGRALNANNVVGMWAHHNSSGGAAAGWNLVKNPNFMSFTGGGYNLVGAYDAGWHVFALRSRAVAPTGRWFYRDGVLGSNIANAVTYGTAPAAEWGIGTFYNGSGLGMFCQVAEVAQINRAMDEAEMLVIVNSLKAKYGIA